MEKELKDISWLVDEPIYRADPALSYSTLAKYEREGFEKLDHLFDQVSTPSLTEGSMTDCLITGSQEEFDQQFYVVDFPSIGDKEKLVADYLFVNYGSQYSKLEEVPSTYVLEAANNYEFQKNWKDETRVRVLTERCSAYYLIKSEAADKIIVTMDTFYKVQTMVRALKEAPATCGYFANDDPMSPVRRYYQLKFKASFNGINYRCMMDEVVVNYEKKVIIPVDLKTSFKKEYNFEKSFMEWKYMIQAILYAAILKDNLAKDPYFKDFTVKNYRFIVVNKESLNPLVWEFPYTFTTSDLVDEDGNVYRHPFTIGQELQAYLDCRPQVPNGINQYGDNIISCLKPKEE